MQKIIYDAAEEQLLMSRLWSPSLRDNPEAFVMFAFPWGQEGTPLERHSGPRKWQRRILRQIASHIATGNTTKAYKVFKKAVKSGRGIGKSALVSWLIIWFLTTRIGASVIVSANTEAQLRTITWGELTKWVTMALHAHWWETTGIKMDPAKWLRELVERDLKKGTRYWGAEGKLWSEENPDAYAGAHNQEGMMVIFDEASGIPDPIWAIASGFFTEDTPNRHWFAFGNPRRGDGYFFETTNAKREFWDTDQIDARTVEGTDKNIYEEIIAEYGADSYEAKVEVYGEDPSGEDENFIALSLVNDAIARPPFNNPDAPVVVGVDPARGGDDTVIVVRKGRDLIHIERHKTPDTSDIEQLVIDVINEYQPSLVVFDITGMGGPIIDNLKRVRFRNIKGVNFAWNATKPMRWGNKRAEMWGEMKEWLKTASIPDDRRLKTDLVGPRKKPDHAGVMYLESKKDMKARGLDSQDTADACAVTFAFPVASSEYNSSISKRKMGYREDHAPVAQGWMRC